ncbi:glyoxalase [Chryseobacterium nematophagum]|uniref:Glyoxalase n=1 Tax=Chryseobacterium nematophagum TaxID=2305228 RepID=A0A3M7LB40_9FLAO|nr:glyoxalase [Chryseobacterium nematophagum]RMZ59963.1 glyoxalase [Chryseobacterium nematophagum]
MKQSIRSIRPFIGAENFDISRNFYQDLGFEEVILEDNLSLFKRQDIAFYLQRAYVKDWIDNTMIFIEVENVDEFWNELSSLNLAEKYSHVRLVPVRNLNWGKECFVHDPSGVLWHFGEFYKPS